MKKEYSFKITLIKGAKYFGIFLLPLLVDRFIISYPDIAQLTVGGLLVMIANYVKMKSSK
jgi:hypothetical protein